MSICLDQTIHLDEPCSQLKASTCASSIVRLTLCTDSLQRARSSPQLPREGRSRHTSSFSRFASSSTALATTPPLEADAPFDHRPSIAESSHNPRPLNFVPWWAHLEERVSQALERATSANAFRTDIDSTFHPRQLASIPTLRRLATLYFSGNAPTPSDWAWLSGQLGHMCAEVDGADDAQKGVSTFGHALRALALARLGQRREAIDEIRRYEEQAEVWGPVVSTARAVMGLAYFYLEEYQRASAEMAGAIDAVWGGRDKAARRGSQDEIMRIDPLVWTAFGRATELAERQRDLLDVVRLSEGTLRRYFIVRDQKAPESSLVFMSSVSAAFISIPDPIAFVQQLGRSTYSDEAHRLGTVFTAVLAREASRLDQAVDVVSSTNLDGIDAAPILTTLADALVESNRLDLLERFFEVTRDRVERYPPRVFRSALKAFATEGMYAQSGRVWDLLLQQSGPKEEDRLLEVEAAIERSDWHEARSLLSKRWSGDFTYRAASIGYRIAVALQDGKLAEQATRVMLERGAGRLAHTMMLDTVTAYAHRAEPEQAKQYIEYLTKQDTSTVPTLPVYTSLMSAYTAACDVTGARQAFATMRQSVEPDSPAWAAMLNAEIIANNWPGVAATWAAIPSELKTTASVINTIMKAAVQMARPPLEIMGLLASVQPTQPQAWAVALQAWSNALEPESAQHWHRVMDELSRSQGGAKPNVYTYSIMIYAYLRADDSTTARQLYEEMLGRGIVPSSVTYSTVVSSFIDSASKASEGLDAAMRFAQTVYDQSKGTVPAEAVEGPATIETNLFGPLVTAAGKRNDPVAAQAYFDAATANAPPSMSMRSKLLHAYARAQDINGVLRTWAEAFAAAPRSPKSNVLCLALSSVFKALGLANRYEDVRRIRREVFAAGFGLDPSNFNQYVVALARTGAIEQAFKVTEQVLARGVDQARARRQDEVALASGDLAVSIDAGLDPEVDPDDLPWGADHIAYPVYISSRTQNLAQLRRMEEDHMARSQENADPRPLGSVADETLASSPPGGTESLPHDDSPVHDIAITPTQPEDILWRATNATLATLDSVLRQLRDVQRSGAWIALPASEDEEELSLDERRGIPLADFGPGVYVRDADGRPERSAPRLVILRLERRFVKARALVMLWRRKREGANAQRGKS